MHDEHMFVSTAFRRKISSADIAAVLARILVHHLLVFAQIGKFLKDATAMFTGEFRKCLVDGFSVDPEIRLLSKSLPTETAFVAGIAFMHSSNVSIEAIL